MRFLKISDMYYYSGDGMRELKQTYNSKKLIKIFNTDELLDAMRSDDLEHIDFISHCLPENLLKDLSNIEIIRVPNKFGLLTKEQKERKVSNFEVLENKIGAKIYQPKATFDDYIIDKNSFGFKALMSQIKMIDIKKKSGLPLKGFFLTGVPGTGKTFFAKCVAGELNRVLIHLNLSVFINESDTFGLLASFFEFFKYNEGKYVVLIDEIEKMLTGNNPKTKQVLGYLLTALNDFGETSYSSEVFFIATANNITVLAQENPELFRKGRFDMSIYLTAPTKDKATDIIAYYISKLQNNFEKKVFPFLIEVAQSVVTGLGNNYLPEKSRAFNIVEHMASDEVFAMVAKEVELEALKQDERVQTFYSELKQCNYFQLDINNIIVDIFIAYRDSLTDRELFPYVPAEIEQMLTELYSFFYFDEKMIDYVEYFEANVPIQLAMKEGILSMNAATQNFVRF